LALTRTAAQLTTSLRNRCDHLVGTFRDDSVLRGYLSDSCRSLVSWLVDDFEELYWAKSATVNAVADVQTTALPADFWKLIAFRLTIDQRRERIQRADLDAIDVEGQSLGGWTGGRWPRHRLIGADIYWAPIPRAAAVVTAFYVPTVIFKDTGGTPIADFAASTDTFDGIFGWDQWVVLDSAIKFANDEGKDSGKFAPELQRREIEIRNAAANRMADDAPKVRDRWDPSDGDGLTRNGRMPPGGFY